LEERRPQHAVLRSAVRPDRWLNYHVYPSRGGVVVFFHDITDQKLAEQSAERSRALFLAAINSLSAHIAILDERGVIVDVNEAWHRFAANNGYVGENHGVGRSYLEICRAWTELASSAPRIAEGLEAVLAGQRDSLVVEYPSGHRWYQLRATRIQIDGPNHVVVTHEDISDLVLVKQSLASPDEGKRREFSQLMRQSVLNRLSSSIAHELNQPLAAIMLNAEAATALLDRPDVDLAAVREMLADIVHEDQRAADVIRRVRGLIKREPSNFEPVSIDSLVDATLSLLRNEALQRNINITKEKWPLLPLVRGEFAELQQILINLIMNAMEACCSMPSFTRSSKIAIKAELAHERIRLIISDNGPGVPPALNGNMFEPFVSTKSEGLGLGLSICVTIAESHGGNIALENNQGGGASAILTLPVANRSDKP
jgi:signal transduction histidine kinase